MDSETPKGKSTKIKDPTLVDARKFNGGNSTKKKDGTKNKGGRPKGSLGKIKRTALDRAKVEHDILPHELMLKWLLEGRMQLACGEYVELPPGQLQSLATSVAPYYAPKLASTEMKGTIDHNVKVDDARDKIRDMLKAHANANTIEQPTHKPISKSASS